MSSLTEFLMREMRMSERELSMLISTAPDRYKVYYIKKRSGGLREIAHPAKELKVAQRAIMNRYLNDLPVHPCATAYRKGASIRLNAERHRESGPIFKMDFKEFFPSITERAWLLYCKKSGIFDREDAIRTGRLLFRRPRGGRVLRLSIGAPSSPILSNILLHEFDQQVHDRVADHKITYTRYADDMTFSAKRTGNLTVVESIVRSVLYRMKTPKLQINTDKTNLVTPKYSRRITGLVITNDCKVSLGRERKRAMRAEVHHFTVGKLDLAAQAKLAGNLAFAKDADPDFYASMERVYGQEVIARLKASVKGFKRQGHK